MAAEKGSLREAGNLVFHLALFGLLIAVAIGSLFGATGQKLVLRHRRLPGRGRRPQEGPLAGRAGAAVRSGDPGSGGDGPLRGRRAVGPALHSYWLWVHVSAAIVFDGVLHTGAIVTLLFLGRDRWQPTVAAGGGGGRLAAV